MSFQPSPELQEHMMTYVAETSSSLEEEDAETASEPRGTPIFASATPLHCYLCRCRRCTTADIVLPP